MSETSSTITYSTGSPPAAPSDCCRGICRPIGKPMKALDEAFLISTANQDNSMLFGKLPIELFQDITSYLPIESQLCLTLTCKLALGIIGKSTWLLVREWRRIGLWVSNTFREHPWEPVIDKLILFLEIISRDTPSLQLCYVCRILHGQIPPPFEFIASKHTWACWDWRKAVIDIFPRTPEGKGYILALPHIERCFQLAGDLNNDKAPNFDWLDGSYNASFPKFEYSLASSASFIGRNLVLRHEHLFSSTSDALNPSDILAMPFRICPHQSTAQDYRRAFDGVGRNRRLFTFTITSAFPAGQRPKVKSTTFRPCTSSENNHIRAVRGGMVDVVFKCQLCPTKWMVEGEGPELLVTAWHCFYENVVSASKVWPWFVRRDCEWVSISTMNCEYIGEPRDEDMRPFQVQ
ncbi:hypothetical protein QBC41DRAFT_386880 [Cercophora samala]|uniref:F-box domain-containing protein n=1 Tax=Cercophora samala TaxID=330535 RepID=A0AA39YMW0_9PEZI|nr:hypothetical protein QBC41DRAFT_386880 [Cercophora samala]